ncbi:MAG: PAS domain S-box protein, partial [Bacteroidota bacterium]
MTQAGSSFQFNTFQDLLSLLRPGSRLIVCLPSLVDSLSLHHPILRSFKNPKRVIALSPDNSRPPLPHSLVLPSTKNPSDAVASVRKAIAKHGSLNGVLVECSHGLGKWYIHGKQRQSYIEAILDLMTKKHIAGVLQIVETDFTPMELARLKDTVECFLHIRRDEAQYVGQLLEAKSIYSPNVLRPFVISPNHTSEPALAFTPIELHVSQSRTSATPTYQQVFDAAPEPMLRIHQTSGRVEANARALSLLGRTAEEVGTVSLAECVAPGRVFGVLKMLLALRRKSRVSGETAIRRKDGRILTVALSASRISDGELVVAMNDISETRKQQHLLLESVDQYKVIVERSPFPVAVFVKRKNVLVNEAFGKTFPGLKAEGFSITDVFGKSNSAMVKEIASLSEDDQKSQHTQRHDSIIIEREGSSKTFDVLALVIPYKSGPAVLCTLIDVTEARAVVDKFSAGQEYYRRLLEEAGEAVSLAQEGKLTHVNRRFVEIFGYDNAADLIGQSTDFLRVGRSHEPEYKKPTSGKKPEVYSFEYEGKKKDGTRLFIEAQSIGLNFNGSPTIVTYHRDVTERKAEEEQFRVSTQAVALTQRIIAASGSSLELSEVLDKSISVLMKTLGMDFGGAYVVHSLNEPLALGHPQSFPEGLLGHLGSQNTGEGITGFVIKTQEPLVLSMASYPPFLPYKSLFETQQIQTIVYLPLIHNTHVIAILFLGSGKAKNITGAQTSALEMLKDQIGTVMGNARNFTTLKQAEELYRSSVENISDVIYQVSAQGMLSFISPNVERLLGYKPLEFHRAADLWRTIIHPDDRANYSQRISGQSDGDDDFHLDYRMLPKGKATYRWIRDSIRYKRGEKGQLLSINGILSDITDRIDLEDALIKSEELKTNVLESVQEGVMVMDSTFTYIDWNNAMESITGIARDQVIGEEAFQRTPQLVNERVRPFLSRALSGEAVSSEDMTITAPGREDSRSIWIRYSPLRNSSGAIRGIVGIVTDISNRKRLELEIRESEETLRNVIDAMGDALMISDLQGRVWEINREFSRVTGYPRNEVLGVDFPYPWVLDEEMAMFVKWIAALREKNYLRDFDMTWRRKDGHMVAISLNTTMLRNAFGEPVAMLNIGRDITDRRKLSLELERKNKQIELLNRIISKANTTMDFGEIFETIAKEVFTLVPFDQINVGLISDAGASMTVYACMSPTGITIPVGSVVKVEETVSRLAIIQEKPVVINDLTVEPGISAETPSIVEGLLSQIA